MEIRDADGLRDDEYPDESDDAPGDSADRRPCPACGADIHELSDHCPHCGHWITCDDVPAGRHTLLWIIVAILAAVALFLAVVF